jgi:hypothetical protein
LSTLREAFASRVRAFQPRFQILDNFLCEVVRFGQIVEVGKALVLEPEDIKARLDALFQPFM